MSTNVEQEYHSRMDGLLPKERVARCTAMLKWTRDLLARQVITETGPIADDRLKWEVAARMYGADAVVVALIDQRLEHVSG